MSDELSRLRWLVNDEVQHTPRPLVPRMHGKRVAFGTMNGPPWRTMRPRFASLRRHLCW